MGEISPKMINKTGDMLLSEVNKPEFELPRESKSLGVLFEFADSQNGSVSEPKYCMEDDILYEIQESHFENSKGLVIVPEKELGKRNRMSCPVEKDKNVGHLSRTVGVMLFGKQRKKLSRFQRRWYIGKRVKHRLDAAERVADSLKLSVKKVNEGALIGIGLLKKRIDKGHTNHVSKIPFLGKRRKGIFRYQKRWEKGKSVILNKLWFRKKKRKSPYYFFSLCIMDL